MILNNLKRFIKNLLVSSFLGLFFFVLSTGSVFARAYEWVDQFGYTQPSLHDHTEGVIFDNRGKIYATGVTLNFSYGNLPNGSFIRKYESDGTFLWGISSVGWPKDIIVDNNANIVVVSQSSNWRTAYVRKYNSMGSELWAREFNPNYTDAYIDVRDVGVDDSGNIYVVGFNYANAYIKKYDSLGTVLWTNLYGIGQFDGVSVKGQYVYVSGKIDSVPFVGKYDLDGNEIWTRQFGFTDARTVDADNQENVYVGGYNFGSGYVRKYNPDGTEIWTQQFQQGFDAVNSVHVDTSDGSIYAGGIRNGRPYLIKYTSNGDYIWDYNFNISSITNGEGYDVAVNNLGDVAMGGRILGRFSGEDYTGNDAFLAYFSSNSVPVANAGQDLSVGEGQQVTINGSGSNDSDGASDIISYTWDLGDGSNGSGQNVTHNYVNEGFYTVTLTVTDAEGATNTDTAIIDVSNIIPIISAFMVSSDPVLVNTQLVTSASFSDPGVLDVHTAVWVWGDGTTSAGVVTETNGFGTVAGDHAYAAVGLYSITLIVIDNGGGMSQYIYEFIHVVDNHPPIANAGLDQLVLQNTVVILSGTESSDSDSDALTYVWSEGTANPQIGLLSDAIPVNPTFIPIVAGTYTFSLVVNDGTIDSTPDEVTITVQTPSEAINDLVGLVESYNLQQGISNSLDAKLDAALGVLDDINQNNNQAATNSLQSFINAVEARRGNQITNEQADILITAAQAIINSL